MRLFYEPLSSSYRESSSLVMGSNIEEPVVNERCRFHDIENLWCIDQPIFPPGGSANPVLTGVAMALNAIDAILKKPDARLIVITSKLPLSY
jgi:choline dehydrogenase-like flavoprotein